MYLDGVIVYSLVVVILTAAVMGFAVRYFYRHVRMEEAEAQSLGDKAASERQSSHP